MHVLTNAEKLIPLRDAASLAESRRLAGMRMVTGTTSPSTRYERISVSPASCSIRSEYVIASHAFKPQYKCINYTPAWEQRKLGDYVVVSTAKNADGRFNKEDVLSVSGEYGIVNQIAFQGRSFAGSSVLNYGIVNTGDIVYTKSPLNSNPYGIIKVNKGIPGIVSTLYAVYRPQDNVHTNFIQVYFEQHERMNNYMHPLVNKGAKNDMKVTAENALKGVVTFPSREEQVIISEFFDRLDSLITLHQRKRQWLKWLDEGGEGTHHDIDILVFKFADDMKISVLCGVHACMTKSLGHTGNRYAGKQQQRGMGVP